MQNFLNIDRYLKYLSDNNDQRYGEIEEALKTYLELNGCKLSRYPRYKTSKVSKEMYDLEIEVIFTFFKEQFAIAIEETQDKRQLQTLLTWKPITSLDLYYKAPSFSVPKVVSMLPITQRAAAS